MGSDEEFATYMAARWPALMRSLIVLGCSPQEAEDVAQVGLARCYSSWDRVQRADDMDAYVYRTILNCWAKSKRRRWWGEQPVDVLPVRATPDPADETVIRHAVEQALGQLSADHRTVLVLRFVADMTEPQVAHTLDIPVGTVKSRVARAIARIKLDDLREETR